MISDWPIGSLTVWTTKYTKSSYRLLHTEAPVSLLKRLVKLMDVIKLPYARACVIWLICTHIDKVKRD